MSAAEVAPLALGFQQLRPGIKVPSSLDKVPIGESNSPMLRLASGKRAATRQLEEKKRSNTGTE